MYTDIPTTGDVAGMVALLLLALVSLLVCVNHHGTNHVDDMASWARNYQKLQRRH